MVLLALDRLVGAEVERADRDRQPLQALDDFPVCLVLLVLVGEVAAIHEEELAAEEAHPRRAARLDALDVGRQFDVRVELHRRPVEGRRGRALQPLQLVALEPRLVLLQPVLGEDAAVRVDDHHALGAVDDDELVLVDERARVVQRHDRGDVHRARDNRGVRGGAAEVRDERGERVLAEEDHVRGRQVARHEDRGVLAHRLDRDAPLRAGERAQDPLGHLAHVVLALLEVRILDVAELREELVQLRAQRPLGVAMLLADDVARRLRERGVVEEEPVHVHEGRELRRRPVAHAVGKLAQLVAHLLHSAIVAALLADHLEARDLVVVHLGRHAREQVRVPDGDAAGNADAVHGEAHARGGRGARAFGCHVMRPRRTCR